MTVLTAKIISNPARRAWAQVFTSPEQDYQAAKGYLTAVVAIERPDEEVDESQESAVKEGDATEIGKLLLTKIQEYWESGPTEVGERLEEVASKISEEFKEESVEIAACAVIKNYIYFVSKGPAKIMVFRENKLYQMEGSLFSGEYRPNDIFLLGTDEFFKSVSQEKIEETFIDKANAQDIADNLSPRVHQIDNPKAGAVLIKARHEGEAIQSSVTTPLPVPTALSPQQPNPVQSYPANTSLVRRMLIKFAQMLPEDVNQPPFQHSSKSKALSIGLVLLLVLGVSIFFGVKQKSARDFKASYEPRLEQAQTLYQEAKDKKDLNKSEAKSLYAQAKEIADNLLAEGIKDKELDELVAQMKADEAALSGRVEGQSTQYLDLSLVRSGVEATELSLEKGRLAVLDKTGERIILVSDTKETSVVGGSDKTPSPQGVALYEERTFVLSRDGIVEIDKRGNSKTVIKADPEWGTPERIGVFGGNLYLLTTDGVVWRYPAISTDTGFGSKQEWLSESTTPLSDTTDWAIDASVWTVTSTGSVSKYTRGAKDSFRAKDAPTSLDARGIYTDPDTESIFIHDKKEGRIIEIAKTGEYKTEYLSAELKDAQDFAVSPSQSKIFILATNKIFEMPLAQ